MGLQTVRFTRISISLNRTASHQERKDIGPPKKMMSVSAVSSQVPLTSFHHLKSRRKSRSKRPRAMPISASDSGTDENDKSTTLITFLGKGGSGRTTSAVFAAQHYAMAGLSTCLVLHSQDPTAEYILNCKIGNSPVVCNSNLSAVRIETTKMLLEPLNQLKQADARLNMTQGVLGGVVGEELGVLPGMDSIFSAFALERLVGFFGNFSQRNHQKEKFDVIVYDGISPEETLRMIGASSKARLYLKYLRNVAEKTDIGRLTAPSLLKLVDEALSISGRRPLLNGNMSAEIWDAMDRMLERGSSALAEPHKFGCFLVMNPNNRMSVNSALRYWGCTIQAGAQVAGAICTASPHLDEESAERVRKNFSPLPLSFLPHLPTDSSLDWNAIMLNPASKEARDLLSLQAKCSSSLMSSVKFDAAKKSVTLLMPGFDKSEIKLYQYRGGSELLVEAGDQRRVIHLPRQIQGKVGGARFIERNLIVTMQ